ncbi:ensconsin-like [Venturia canescens]|uniref:ensconsin-like n=1 Tax=Venturia canescens TaxID=32260 RepID=UPI001C9CE06C|nr:ensconsin-like [Venturia canescens]XP_043275139.1 ensconsin-like [Venturia canescens]
MEGFRAFAVWLLLLGVVGTLGQPHSRDVDSSDAENFDETNVERALERLELVRQIDEERGPRVARGLPSDRKPFKHPTADKMRADRKEAQNQRILKEQHEEEEAQKRDLEAKRQQAAEQKQKEQEAERRAQIERGVRVAVQMEASDNLRAEERARKRGQKELAERVQNANKKRKN